MALTPTKLRVFSYHVSKRCPACKGPKNRLHWVCVPCADYAGNTKNSSAEWEHLVAACEAHVEAAELYIAKAAQRLQK